MAFSIELTNELCDKCRKLGNAFNPVIQLKESSKGFNKHVIFVHVDCINKAVKRLMTKQQNEPLPALVDGTPQG